MIVGSAVDPLHPKLQNMSIFNGEYAEVWIHHASPLFFDRGVKSTQGLRSTTHIGKLSMGDGYQTNCHNCLVTSNVLKNHCKTTRMICFATSSTVIIFKWLQSPGMRRIPTGPGLVCPLQHGICDSSPMLYIHIWLVVWNIDFPFFEKYWEFHHPNWWTHICSEGWLNYNPVLRKLVCWYSISDYLDYMILSMISQCLSVFLFSSVITLATYVQSISIICLRLVTRLMISQGKVKGLGLPQDSTRFHAGVSARYLLEFSQWVFPENFSPIRIQAGLSYSEHIIWNFDEFWMVLLLQMQTLILRQNQPIMFVSFSSIVHMALPSISFRQPDSDPARLVQALVSACGTQDGYPEVPQFVS